MVCNQEPVLPDVLAMRTIEMIPKRFAQATVQNQCTLILNDVVKKLLQINFRRNLKFNFKSKLSEFQILLMHDED